MIIKSTNVWLDSALKKAALSIENGKIKAILPYDTEADVDYGKLWILPGFIDAHTHGNNGAWTENPNSADMQRWQREIAADGVTGFMATTATNTVENNLHNFEVLSKCVGKGNGAEILGIYMEGNFINPKSKGAHNEKLILKPDAELIQKYIDACNGTMRIMILASELDEDGSAMAVAKKNGVRVSVGHSSATYEDCVTARRRGAISFTHTFNGMAPFNHRQVGIIGAAMTMSDMFAEIIADGHHVSWPAVKLLATMKDDHHIVLITDASPYKGYDGPLTIRSGIHRDAEGQFRTESGALASSSLRVCDGVFNLIHKADVPVVKAINAATINPATLLGVSDRKGTLDEGKDADITVVTPEFEVKQTYCRGEAML